MKFEVHILYVVCSVFFVYSKCVNYLSSSRIHCAHTEPEVVRNITVANVTTSSISLTWIEPKGNSSSYRVQWTDGNVTHNNSVNTTSITITNLTAGVQYKITVAAVTNEGSTEGQNTSVSQYTSK